MTEYVDVLFDGTQSKRIPGIYQYNHGMLLRVRGVPTDVIWGVHYGYRGGNDSVNVTSQTEGDAVTAQIPDAQLMQQREIICYMYYEDEDYGLTVYEIDIPVIPRLKPTADTYTPEQIDNYNELVAALQGYVTQTSELAEQTASLVTQVEGMTFTLNTNDGCLYLTMPDEESATNLGKACIVPKGTYNSATAYTRLDLVTDNGNTYLAIADSTGASLTDTTKWLKLIDGTQNIYNAVAPAYTSLTFPVKAGQICWQNGAQYAANEDIDTSEAWTAAHWTQITVARELERMTDIVTSVAAEAFPQESVSGSPAHFTDGAAMPVKQITVDIPLTQSGEGTPSPANIRPITGFTEANVAVDAENVYALGGDNYLVQGGLNTSSGTTTSNGYRVRSQMIQVEPGKAYTIYSDTAYAMALEFSDNATSSYLSVNTGLQPTPLTFTTTEDTHYIRLVLSKSTTTNQLIRPAEVKTLFITTSGGTVKNIAFPAEAGTVYIGSLTLNSDGSGTLNVTHTGVILDGVNYKVGELTQIEQDTELTQCIGKYRGTLIKLDGTTLTRNTKLSNIAAYCSHFVFEYRNSSAGRAQIIPDTIFNTSYSPSSEMKIVFDTYSTAEDANAYFASQAAGDTPIVLVWRIRANNNPVTYVLTADQTRVIRTLLGENYVQANCGDVTVEYYANPQLYVHERLEDYANMIGPDENAVAITNHSIGDLIRSGYNLYRATAAIASGETLTPGTNVVQTTIAQEKNSIDQRIGAVSTSLVENTDGTYTIVTGGVE